MKKKVGDLTLKEIVKVHKNQHTCENCPFDSNYLTNDYKTRLCRISCSNIGVRFRPRNRGRRMNKYLEAFNQLKIGDYSLLDHIYVHEEELDIVEEGLNALNMIIIYKVDVRQVMNCDTVDDYNSSGWFSSRMKLNNEQFIFLKGVIEKWIKS